MAVRIKLNGETIAICYGSKILGITPQEEAKQFLESYKKIFHKITVNGVIQEEIEEI